MLTPASIHEIKATTVSYSRATSIDQVSQTLWNLSYWQETGRLDIKVPGHRYPEWSLFFCRGRLIGGDSSLHPMRRWHRQVSRHCPQLADYPVEEGYETLMELLRREYIQRGQFESIIAGYITEILFDVCQHFHLNHAAQGLENPAYASTIWESCHSPSLSLLYRPIPEHALDANAVGIQVDVVWQQTEQVWQAWLRAGLENYSPNLAPMIPRLERLKLQVLSISHVLSTSTYNLISLADGKHPLRDLAIQLDQNLLSLTQSIITYVRQGVLQWAQVEDLNLQTNLLIASIGDSPLTRHILRQILAQSGYHQILNVRNPSQAIPTLLKHKPSLIFLDLVMPVVSGYEVCAQIRRISDFKNTPVVMLANDGGVIDRLRAKLVGSTSFLSQPVRSEQVLGTLQRYLPRLSPSG
ncbi:MAG: response regulator [Cyanothece sp. SIO1E1]|nr:response regulator [Cyanothece sp. SIO1E1]